MNEIDAAMLALKRCSTFFTKQEYKTIKGQILSGNIKAAYKGMEKLKLRKGY